MKLQSARPSLSAISISLNKKAKCRNGPQNNASKKKLPIGLPENFSFGGVKEQIAARQAQIAEGQTPEA